MIAIVGLGNSGEEYLKTRHNVGFFVVNKLAGEKSWVKSKSGLLDYCWIKNKKSEEIELVRPTTFMNNSGDAVGYLIKKHINLKLESLWVIHDDLDIQLGKYKIGFGKGPRDHGGLLSIYSVLNTRDFWHVRIGIDARENLGEVKISGEDYVLGKFLDSELQKVDQVVNEVVDYLKRNVIDK